MKSDQLLVGEAEVDITPPVGTALAGGLAPRASIGIQDPLYVKAIVLESGGRKLAYVVLDLIKLSRKEGDEAVRLACEQTGMAPGQIVWAVTHTHTGPYTAAIFGAEEGGIDEQWLATIPVKFAEAVEKAHADMKPARMTRLRGFEISVLHNRRLMFKDGRAINTWNLAQADENVQCLGAAGPTDPEIGILAFDDEEGNLLGLLYHFTLHTNTNFGARFSADYPAVVAARIREQFGPHAFALFLPGAFADINTPGKRCRQVGDALADAIIAELEGRPHGVAALALASVKREVTVPFRDFTLDQAERIRTSGWPAEAQAVFRRELEIMRKEGTTQARTVLQAWRIGDVGFASLPGELFVEWGLKIKRESPFSWTYPVELGGDYLGYLVTEQAWLAGGYESLIARSAKPSYEGVSHMVDNALGMLTDLYSEGMA